MSGCEKPLGLTVGGAVRAKAAQGYVRYAPKPVWPRCGNCKHCTVDRYDDRMGARGDLLMTPRGRKCGIGKFAVAATGKCERWEYQGYEA